LIGRYLSLSYQSIANPLKGHISIRSLHFDLSLSNSVAGEALLVRQFAAAGLSSGDAAGR
jgi:hypothetical protein